MQKIIAKNNIITPKVIAMIIISFFVTLFLTKQNKTLKKKSKIKTFKSTYNFISGTADHFAVKNAATSIKKENNNREKPKEIIIEDAIMIDI